jgi:hypothetical protein
MVPVFSLLAILTVLVLIDVASLRWGTDSRHTSRDRPDWW